MYNREVCEYVNNIDPQKKFIADLCVEEGYGQSCGGYLTSYKRDDKKSVKPSQKEHFLNYYGDKGEKMPTYNYLRCPQLLLFVAEVCGLPRKELEVAYEIVKKYEKDKNLKDEDKNGNYMWGKPEFQEFKVQLNIGYLVKIIKSSPNMVELMKKV
ncbi:MAG: hypothetical protein RR661_04980 [Anaerovoracaceae bacterium]